MGFALGRLTFGGVVPDHEACVANQESVSTQDVVRQPQGREGAVEAFLRTTRMRLKP